MAKKPSEFKILTETDLCRLILSDPTVYSYDLEKKHIKAILNAYSKVIRDAFEVDVRVPLTKVGYFYPSYREYKGDGNSMYFGHKVPASKTKRLKFKNSSSLTPIVCELEGDKNG